MLKILLLRGLPASSKTTFAKELLAKDSTYKRVNRDSLREMIDIGVWSKKNEDIIKQAEKALASLFLSKGFNVIVDDCNLADAPQEMWKNFARENNVKFEIKDFTDVSLEECIARDQKRPNYVGEKVIRGMWNSFLKPKPPVIEHDPKLPDAIWVDCDGTLALFGNANPYERNFLEDRINGPVVHAVNAMADRGCKIIIVSGRKDIFRKQTEEWLKQNFIPYDYLYMRKTQPDGVQEPKDTIVKEEIYNEYIKDKFNILFCLDDRPVVVRMLREKLGLFVLDVDQSGIDF